MRSLRSIFRCPAPVNFHKEDLTIGKSSSARWISSASGDPNSLFHESSLTKDQIELQGLVHSFLDKEMPASLASQIDRNDEFPELRQFWRKLGNLGLHGITAPKEYGGLQLGYLEHCLVMEAMSQYSGSVALSYGAHSNLCINQLCLNGNEQQKAHYLPKLIDGSWIGSLAMSEPNSGSDVTSMRTTAVKKGDSYLINGSKFWITNGALADVCLVYAKTGTKEISAFLLDKGTAGFSVGQKIHKMGMRGSPTSELIFQDCLVPEANLLGRLHHGVYVLMSGLDYERLLLAAGPLGLMQRACQLAFEYAHQRRQFGEPIGHFQMVQGIMADMFTETMFCRSTLYSVARSLDQHPHEHQQQPPPGEPAAVDRSGANLLAARCAALILKLAETGNHVVDQALQLLGGNGYTEDYEASRLLRDARLYRIGAGTSEIRRWLIGRAINKAYRA